MYCNRVSQSGSYGLLGGPFQKFRGLQAAEGPKGEGGVSKKGAIGDHEALV